MKRKIEFSFNKNSLTACVDVHVVNVSGNRVIVLPKKHDEEPTCIYCNDTHVLIDGDEERTCWHCYDFEDQ